MNEYDVRKAFEEMELELIASMKRNLQRHLDWEKDEGFCGKTPRRSDKLQLFNRLGYAGL